MRTLVVSMIAAVAILSASTMAVPADGAAIARIGQQVDVVVVVKTKKPKTKKTAAPTAPPPREPSQSY